jgi:hypothetical protein
VSAVDASICHCTCAISNAPPAESGDAPQAHAQVFGSVTPRCPMYLPPRSR